MKSVTNWWYGTDPESEKQKQINSSVVSSQQTEQELRLQRSHLMGNLEDIKSEMMALSQEEDAEAQREALYDEFVETEAQVADLDALLHNMRLTNGALKTATTNKNVFDAQRGAADALHAVNGQLRETDVKRLNGQLEVNIDKNRAVSSAMTKRLNVRQTKPTAKTQDAKARRMEEMNNKMAKWSTGKLPTAPKVSSDSPVATPAATTAAGIPKEPEAIIKGRPKDLLETRSMGRVSKDVSSNKNM